MKQVPLHLSTVFIALVFTMAFIILMGVYFSSKKLNLPDKKLGKNLWLSIGAMLSWFLLVFILSAGLTTGVSGATAVLLMVSLTPLLAISYLMFVPGFNKLTDQVGAHWFIYLQSYRLLREFILLMLYRYQCIPYSYTMYGTNFDIIIGLSAPFVAYYCVTQHKNIAIISVVWNALGLISITNILVKIMLSVNPAVLGQSPSTEGLFITHFPFIWLPAFLLPLGVLLHFISLRRALFARAALTT